MDVIHISGTELIWLVVVGGVIVYGWLWIPRTKKIKVSPQQGMEWDAEDNEHVSEVSLSISQQLTDVSKQMNEIAISFTKMQSEIYKKFDSVYKRLDEGNVRFVKIENELIKINNTLNEESRDK